MPLMPSMSTLMKNFMVWWWFSLFLLVLITRGFCIDLDLDWVVLGLVLLKEWFLGLCCWYPHYLFLRLVRISVVAIVVRVSSVGYPGIWFCWVSCGGGVVSVGVVSVGVVSVLGWLHVRVVQSSIHVSPRLCPVSLCPPKITTRWFSGSYAMAWLPRFDGLMDCVACSHVSVAISYVHVSS